MNEYEKIQEDYREVWAFHKKYFNPSADDTFWINMIHDNTLLREKHKGDAFFLALLQAATTHIENRVSGISAESSNPL